MVSVVVSISFLHIVYILLGRVCVLTRTEDLTCYLLVNQQSFGFDDIYLMLSLCCIHLTIISYSCIYSIIRLLLNSLRIKVYIKKCLMFMCLDMLQGGHKSVGTTKSGSKKRNRKRSRLTPRKVTNIFY